MLQFYNLFNNCFEIKLLQLCFFFDLIFPHPILSGKRVNSYKNKAISK